MDKHNTRKKKNQEFLEKQNLVKKKNQELLGYINGHVSETTLERITGCNNRMGFVADKEKIKNKQVAGESCKNPFCPICSCRKARKDALAIATCMKYIENEYKKTFVFLHLTAPNVTGDKLIDEVTRFNKAFKKMFERKDIETINKGYIRKLEITYNEKPIITQEMWDGNPEKKKKPMFEYFQRLGLMIGDPNPNYDTYHAHFHVVIAVNQSYFTDRTYINQEKWLSMWREAMSVPEITQVRVERIKENGGKEIQEIAKYSAKSSDYLVSQEVFGVFYKALDRRQKITYSGLFAEANKLFKAKKLDKYKEIDQTEYIWLLLYSWGAQKYIETECRELTEVEKARYSGKLVDEIEIEVLSLIEGISQ